jgi:hypothetical protein
MAEMFQVKVCWVMTLCSVVVGYQCFKGPYCLHLEGEMSSVGENSTDIGPDWRGVAGVTSQSRKCGGSRMATSAIGMRRESHCGCHWELQVSRVLVESPALANKERYMVAVSSKVVTACTAAVRIQG